MLVFWQIGLYCETVMLTTLPYYSSFIPYCLETVIDMLVALNVNAANSQDAFKQLSHL